MKRETTFCVITVLLLALLRPGISRAQVLPEVSVPHESASFQFRSSGHIIGFMSGKIYVVGAGFVLMENFVDARPAPPKPAASGKVVYGELWEGISATYSAGAHGFAEGTFKVMPGAGIEAIRFKYNLAAAVLPSGLLRLQQPASGEYFLQAPPEAVQVVNGQRHRVEVTFKDYGDNVIGFTLGEYDKTVPIIIGPIGQWRRTRR